MDSAEAGTRYVDMSQTFAGESSWLLWDRLLRCRRADRLDRDLVSHRGISEMQSDDACTYAAFCWQPAARSLLKALSKGLSIRRVQAEKTKCRFIEVDGCGQEWP